MDYTVHGLLQARIMEWAAYLFSRGSPWPRNRTGVSCIAGGFFTNWTIREAPRPGCGIPLILHLCSPFLMSSSAPYLSLEPHKSYLNYRNNLACCLPAYLLPSSNYIIHSLVENTPWNTNMIVIMHFFPCRTLLRNREVLNWGEGQRMTLGMETRTKMKDAHF